MISLFVAESVPDTPDHPIGGWTMALILAVAFWGLFWLATFLTKRRNGGFKGPRERYLTFEEREALRDRKKK